MKPPAFQEARPGRSDIDDAGPGRHPPRLKRPRRPTRAAWPPRSCSTSTVPKTSFSHSNATHALNLAIKSLVRRDGRVVISGYEHNSVTRPLTAVGARVAVRRLRALRAETGAARLRAPAARRHVARRVQPRLKCFRLHPAGRTARAGLPRTADPVRARRVPVGRRRRH